MCESYHMLYTLTGPEYKVDFENDFAEATMSDLSVLLREQENIYCQR